MPHAAPHPCTYPGCSTLTLERQCGLHRRQERQRLEAVRPNAAGHGYDARWRKAHHTRLLQHPFCVIYTGEDRLTSATVVDHIRPHGGNCGLFWDEANWQPLRKSCHDKKTACEDGRWG